MEDNRSIRIGKHLIRVTDPPFSARGDGTVCDRAAIQNAIDSAASMGGGTVVLPAGHRFLTGTLVLRTHTALLFEEGAELCQSPDPGDYVKPIPGGYEPYRPMPGHNYSAEIKWSHWWYRNYPLLFAERGAHDFAVRGPGCIRMMEVTDPEKILKICPIGFFDCHRFEIADVHITNYHSYAMMPFSSTDGLIRNVRIDGSSHGNGDGICMMNCRNMRVTGCTMMTGDDSVYLFSSYRDPRKSEWWSSDDPQPSLNIEIDHNDLRSDHCKAFGMILWGIGCPDPEKIEVRNLFVHDNHFETMGVWLYNPYCDKGWPPPVTTVRFENNTIDGIEANFFETQISDMNCFRSSPVLCNGNFEQGRCFWAMTGNADVERHPESGEKPYGRIDPRGSRSAIFQGLWMEAGRKLLFRAEAKTENGAHLFVRALDTGSLIAEAPVPGSGWEEVQLLFEVPENGNYHIGLESGSPGVSAIREAQFSGVPSAFGYRDVIFDNGKIIYRYRDDLFRR
ncbi:MAG: hypothetical protein IKQ87_04585 [Clostridia bacterium]|nr:hypothetical protein [Clostridia bacterium]